MKRNVWNVANAWKRDRGISTTGAKKDAAPDVKEDFDDDGAAPGVADGLGDDVHVCRVNWAESSFVVPFADAAFTEDSHDRITIAAQGLAGFVMTAKVVSPRRLVIRAERGERAHEPDIFQYGHVYPSYCDRSKKFTEAIEKLMTREDDDKVFDTMVIELPFEVDEEFFDHGDNSDGVTYVDVGEDGERFLVVDMKKKAERKAKPTPVLKVPGKKKK